MRFDAVKNPFYLIVTGSLLAATVLLSKYVSSQGIAMLWFLSLALMGAGLVLGSVAFLKKMMHGQLNRGVLFYSVGSGLFHAVPNTLAYMSVLSVGAGFVTLAYAFPLLVTYLISLAIGLDKPDVSRIAAVACALVGGLLIASAKFGGLQDGGSSTLWVFAACAIPFIIAMGNIYRTRYWPNGAKPLILATFMLFIAGLSLLPLALFIQGVQVLPAILRAPEILMLLGLNIFLFALQFVFYFKLQQEAGPVYLSQIGSVSAAVGTPLGVLYFGEVLPDVFGVAIVLIVIGVVLFQKPIKTKKTKD